MKTIRVKAKHIKEGIKGNPWCCPIALAIKDELRSDARVYVVQERLTIDMSGTIYGCQSQKLPKEAVTFIRRFDKGNQVTEFSFDIKDIK